MCNALPRPRCAGHLKPQLDSKTVKLQKKRDELAVAESNLIVAKKEKNSRSVKRFSNEVSLRKSETAKVEKQLEHLQREYDGTATGARELEDALETCDPSQRPVLHDRLVKGKAAHAYRNRMYDNKQKNRGRKQIRSAIIGLGDGQWSDEKLAA